jgi:hypothetical protein
VVLDAEHRPLVGLAPFSDQTRESEWRLARSRRSHDVNAEVREAVNREAIRCFGSHCPSRKFRRHKTFLRASFFSAQEPATTSRVFSSIHFEEEMMGRGILLWLLGVPIPVIILLWLFFGR